MDKKVLTFDSDWSVTGAVERPVAHREGILHGSVHMYVLDARTKYMPEAERKYIVEVRSRTRDILPGAYDVPAGHIEADGEDMERYRRMDIGDVGELFKETAVHELHEELGIIADEDELALVRGMRCYNFLEDGRKNNELIRAYEYVWNGDISEIKLDSESEKVELLSIGELRKIYDTERHRIGFALAYLLNKTAYHYVTTPSAGGGYVMHEGLAVFHSDGPYKCCP